jgi:hypothetical protein
MDANKLVVRPPDMAGAAPPIYANVAHVSSTPYDFRLTFSLLSTPHDRSDRDPLAPALPPRPVVEVILPAAAVGSILDLVRFEFDEFVQRFGAPQPSPAQARTGDGIASRVR